MTVRNSIGRSGILLIAGVITWYVWVLILGVISPYDLELTSPYLVTPLALALGIVTGAFLRGRWRRGRVIQIFIVSAIMTAMASPIYANASAAVGGLFIALIGLATLVLQEAMQPNHLGLEYPREPAADDRALRQAIVLALVLCAGVLLVLDSQAAIALTVPLGLIIALSVWRQSSPPQWIVVVLGCLVAAGAVVTVVFLGSRRTWPDWMAASESLSSARHILWADALNLWAAAPLVGSGPGSFTPSSELASRVPSLAAVHSLPLQIGSELGAIGVALLAVLFIGGLFFATQGSRPEAMIAMAAWTALAVHSSIDHLEDFFVVAFMAGVVLGWSALFWRSWSR